MLRLRSTSDREGIDIRYVLLKTVAGNMAYILDKLLCEDNSSDVLTHSPTKDDLDKLLPMIGIYPLMVVTREVRS